MQGQGGATSELEQLREKLELLEARMPAPAPEPTPRRMVELWPGSNVFSPYYGREDPGEAAIRQVPTEQQEPVEFVPRPLPPARKVPLWIGLTDIHGREVTVFDYRGPEAEPRPFSAEARTGKLIDTRTGEFVPGPVVDARRNALIDRIAEGFDKIDRAEQRRRLADKE
jgi:hypothetical protein